MENKFKLVEIVWEDITFFNREFYFDELKELITQKIKTIGYLIKEDKKYIILAMSLENVKPYRIIDIYKIPKSNIIKRRILK